MTKKSRRHKEMKEHIEVIGIDHGWSTMKTAHSIFTSGVKEISTEPALKDNLLFYEGKYFRIGGRRLEVKPTKVTDENYYLLTLAAVAKELKYRGLKYADVFLSVGLPISRFGAEKQDFINYLSRKKEVSFAFEGEYYRINIVRISVFPQCYAAVAEKLAKYRRRQLIVDIGSWTMDIMPIEDMVPDEGECFTQEMGLITCMREINEECVRKLNGEIAESDMQYVMRTGDSELTPEYTEIVEATLREFASRVYRIIREHKYNLDLTPITFVGGGAMVMKLFGESNKQNIRFIEDIKANAIGYEYLANIILASERKKGAIK